MWAQCSQRGSLRPAHCISPPPPAGFPDIGGKGAPLLWAKGSGFSDEGPKTCFRGGGKGQSPSCPCRFSNPFSWMYSVCPGVLFWEWDVLNPINVKQNPWTLRIMDLTGEQQQQNPENNNNKIGWSGIAPSNETMHLPAKGYISQRVGTVLWD